MEAQERDRAKTATEAEIVPGTESVYSNFYVITFQYFHLSTLSARHFFFLISGERFVLSYHCGLAVAVLGVRALRPFAFCGSSARAPRLIFLHQHIGE
jgi:hypothetical protein